MTTADRIANLRAEADRLESTTCTGLSAQWCPIHGTCRCPDREDAMNSPECPLHSTTSSHAEETP